LLFRVEPLNSEARVELESTGLRERVVGESADI
jgi:hypothetical protein